MDERNNPTPESYYEIDREGRIVGLLRVDMAAIAANAAAGKDLWPGEPDAVTQYHLNGKLVARPENTAWFDGHVLRDVPVPSYVWFRGERYECLDGVVEFDIDQDEGETDLIRIQSFPYMDKDIHL